jgi:V/A-type H+-transporting ATPase subunit D
MVGARDIVATRSALLELKDEQRFTREGHELLDQKLMLLAAEILRWLARYDGVRAKLFDAQHAARKALAEAVALHGAEELAVHPPGRLDLEAFSLQSQSFLGVPLVTAHGSPAPQPPAVSAANPSPEARRCRERHAELVSIAIEAAVLQGNLIRLLAEYRRTERRARALENLVLPELELTLKLVEEQLEEQDQEEAAQVRLRRGSP